MPNIDWEWLGRGAPWLLVGLLIGYTAGRLHDKIKEIWMERKKRHPTNERGIFTHRISANIAAVVIVVVTAVAAFQSQRASNDAQDAIDGVERQTAIRNAETRCVSSVVFTTIQALNERTTYTIEQADANVALQRAQAELITFFLNTTPDTPAEEGRAAISRYFQALQKFTDLAAKSAGKAESYAYPTEEEFLGCLSKARHPAQEG